MQIYPTFTNFNLQLQFTSYIYQLHLLMIYLPFTTPIYLHNLPYIYHGFTYGLPPDLPNIYQKIYPTFTKTLPILDPKLQQQGVTF